MPARCRAAARGGTAGAPADLRRRRRSRLTGLFVTGTDTGVGKTYLAAAICAALRADGVRVGAFKPVVTGLDDAGPSDTQLLAAAAGTATVPHEFGPPVSPHLAAALAGTPLQPDALVAAARAAAAACDVLVVEGVGGLLVPLTDTYLVRDFAVALGYPLVVAARPGLGTINHTLLTVEAARTAGLPVRAVVLTPYPEQPSVMEQSNRETIAALGPVDVHTLAPGAPAADLPISYWLR
ncbi:MAG TPA: dethiobiotin synthase [Solirubrobacteraceae bacterium]